VAISYLVTNGFFKIQNLVKCRAFQQNQSRMTKIIRVYDIKVYILHKNVYKSKHTKVLAVCGQKGDCFYRHVADRSLTD
jgi:hypothetical protein